MTKWPASERLRAWPWTSLTGASATFAASASRGLHELWRRTAPPSHRGSPPPTRSGRPEAFLRVSLDNHRRRLALRRGSSDGDGSGGNRGWSAVAVARRRGATVTTSGMPASQRPNCTRRLRRRGRIAQAAPAGSLSLALVGGSRGRPRARARQRLSRTLAARPPAATPCTPPTGEAGDQRTLPARRRRGRSRL